MVTPMDITTQRPSAAKPALRHLYDLVAAEGFQPKVVDGGGDQPRVWFTGKAETECYSANLDLRDADYFELEVTARIRPFPDAGAMFWLANTFQKDSKGIRILVHADANLIQFQSTMFLGGHRLGTRLLRRCMAELRKVADEFRLLSTGMLKPTARA
jgi:hypothetical protein